MPLILLLAAGALSAGCPGRAPATTPAAPQPAPVEPAPAPPPPPPAPGERQMNEADLAWRSGDLGSAARSLDEVIAMGAASPARGEAMFRLAVILARPDAPARDVMRAQSLLVQALAETTDPARVTETRLLLDLLGREAEAERSIADLRAQLESERSESDSLRAALAKREGELRKIKEILLDKTP